MSISNNTIKLQELLDKANNLPDITGGVELPELTSPATTSEVFSGKEYIDAEGTKQTGEFSINLELSEQEMLLTSLSSALDGKASGGSSSYDTCSVTIQGMYTAQSRRGHYTAVNNGVLDFGEFDSNCTITNVLCGSNIVIIGSYLGATATAGTVYPVFSGSVVNYLAPTEPNSSATLTLVQD